MEDIRIIHQFEEGNKTFIIAESSSVKKYFATRRFLPKDLIL